MKELSDLQKIGLTEYESKVYLTLVSHGILNAKTVSRYSDVPQNRVYETALALQKYGFVDIILGKPKKFKAFPPEIAIKNWMGIRQEELERTEKGAKELIASLLKIQFKEKAPKVDVWVVKGEREVINKRTQLLQLCKKERKAIISVTRGLERGAELRFRRTLAKAAKKGIKFRAVCTPHKGLLQTIQFCKSLGFKIRFYELPLHAKIYTIDEEIAFIESTESPPENWFLMWTNSPPIVKILSHYFEILWEKASKKLVL